MMLYIDPSTVDMRRAVKEFNPDAGTVAADAPARRWRRVLGKRRLEAFTSHWTNADAQSLASLWSDEGDIVHPDGLIERGREVIRANRAALFMRPEYRGSRHPLTMGDVRCVTGDVAVADGKWELRNLSDERNRTLPTFEGPFTLVVGRSGEGWRIDAYRYTLKPAAVPMPALLKRPGFPGGA